MGNIYYIGGGICSGKSTLARRLADRYGMAYYCLDDHLDEFMDLGARKGDAYLKNAYKMQGDALWMRDTAEMAEESLEIYRRIYKFCLRDLRRLAEHGDVIAEGAGYLPELMKNDDVAADRYICMVSAPNFERQRYETMNFVNYCLALCSDRDKAFDNWMDRDARVAFYVKKSAEENGYSVFTIDNASSEDNMQRSAEEAFGLK